MSFRHSSGVWGVVAVAAFSLPGAGVIVATLLGLFDAGVNASFALFGLGVVMISIGAAAALWRIEVVIERDSRTVTEKRWLVGFTRRESYDWSSIQHVEIHSRPNGDRFDVRLGAPDGRIYLDEFSDHERACRVADEVSAVISVPVVDLTDESASAE